MTKKLYVVGYLAVALCLAYSLFWFLPPGQLIKLNREDGVIEYAGAIALLVTSVLFTAAFVKSRTGNELFFFRTRKNIFLLLLGLLFLFGFLEEISWGQRLFHLPTPELFSQYNQQNEITFHNLYFFHSEKSGWRYFLNGNRLLTLFWFAFCVALPLVHWGSRGIQRLALRLNLPIVPLFLGSLFVFHFLLVHVIQPFVSPELVVSLVEFKETMISLLFVPVGIWFLARQATPGTTGMDGSSSGEARQKEGKRVRSVSLESPVPV